MVHSESTAAAAATVQLPDQSGSNTPEDPVSQQCSANSDSFTPLPAMTVALGDSSSYEGATDLSAYQQPDLMTPSSMAVSSIYLTVVVEKRLGSDRNELLFAPRRDIRASQPSVHAERSAQQLFHPS
jgi:hypothetical protein